MEQVRIVLTGEQHADGFHRVDNVMMALLEEIRT
jgi:hypothetical protein